MESKYEKMIEGAAADIVFDLQSSALTCAWTSSPIPVMYWEQEISAAFKEVFEDILADKVSDRIHTVSTSRRIFKKVQDYWRKRNRE